MIFFLFTVQERIRVRFAPSLSLLHVRVRKDLGFYVRSEGTHYTKYFESVNCEIGIFHHFNFPL